jgi:hypothetical protein
VKRTTLIIAIITFLDGVASLTAAPCSVTFSGCGKDVVTPPTDFVVNVSDPVDPATLDASDLTVNGTPANSVILSNGNATIDFTFNTSPVVQGFNTIHISAGAFNCGGGPVSEFTCTFRYEVPRFRPTPRPQYYTPPPNRAPPGPFPPAPGGAGGAPPRPFPPAPKRPPPRPVPMPTPSMALSSVGLADQSVRELDWGNIAFNAPASMRYAQPQVVELLLSPSLSVADLQAQLQQKVGAESAPAQISNRMEAQLTGSGFAIEAQMPDLQAVTSQPITRWTWKVTPTGHGPQTLHLTLSAHIDVAGRDAPLVVRTFDREIQVNITIPQRVSGFIQKNWQWLWVAIVVPIAGYLLKRRRKAPPAP